MLFDSYTPFILLTPSPALHPTSHPLLQVSPRVVNRAGIVQDRIPGKRQWTHDADLKEQAQDEFGSSHWH